MLARTEKHGNEPDSDRNLCVWPATEAAHASPLSRVGWREFSAQPFRLLPRLCPTPASAGVAAELITLQAGDHLTRESLHEAELVDHAGKEHELTEALSV